MRAVGIIQALFLVQGATAFSVPPRLSRRAAAGLAVSAVTARKASALDVTTPKQAAALIAASPPLEYLEPLYELGLSLEALNTVAQDESRWPNLKKRLDKFFSGGLLSEKAYYLGLNLQYISKIQYNDLAAFVSQDRELRKQTFEDAIGSLEKCKKALESESPDKSTITSSAARAKDAYTQWLGYIPKADVERVGQLFRSVRAADTDRNGKLSPTELATLAPDDAAVWKARVDLVGD